MHYRNLFIVFFYTLWSHQLNNSYAKILTQQFYYVKAMSTNMRQLDKALSFEHSV